MQHTNAPNKSAWNPLSRYSITPQGFVAGSFYYTPYLRANVWNTIAGVTQQWTAPNTYKIVHLATRKQGGWVVAVPHVSSAASGVLVIPFSANSGFGTIERVLDGTVFNGCVFNRDGNKILLATSSSLRMFEFSNAGLGSEISIASTGVQNITNVATSFELNTYIVTGASGGMELRSFDNVSSSGVSWSGAALGDLAYPALSGICLNGYRYWAVGQNQGSKCWFGRLTSDNAFGSAYYVNVSTDKTRKVFSVTFCENRNCLLVGQNTNDNDTDNPGNDLHSWVLGATLNNETGPPSGSYDGARATNGNNRGGAPWSLLCVPGTDSVIAGLGYGWNNTRGLDGALINANGSLGSGVSAGSMGAGVQSLDWF